MNWLESMALSAIKAYVAIQGASIKVISAAEAAPIAAQFEAAGAQGVTSEMVQQVLGADAVQVVEDALNKIH